MQRRNINKWFEHKIIEMDILGNRISLTTLALPSSSCGNKVCRLRSEAAANATGHYNDLYNVGIHHYFTIPFSKYSAKLQRTFRPASSAATLAISLSTMIFTNSSKEVVLGFQLSFALALVGSPQRLTTSVGR